MKNFSKDFIKNQWFFLLKRKFESQKKKGKEEESRISK